MKALKINFQVNYKKDSLDGFFYDEKKDVWFIESNVDSPEIDDHWNNIKEILNIQKDKLIGVSKVNIIVYDTDRLTSVMIPPEMSRLLGEFQANIKILTEEDFLKVTAEKEPIKNDTFTSPIENQNSIPDNFFKEK